jgi:hypothetical protein
LQLEDFRQAHQDEGANVNRPFQAFGTLLMLLAVAMLAVNSGSRTTMFDRPPAAAKKLAPPRGSRLGGVYVIVLPAGEAEAAEEELPDLLGLLDGEWARGDLPGADGCTFYDAVYDRAVYGELAGGTVTEMAAPSNAAARTPVRSGRWLLRFAASSLNQLGRACETAASQLESLGSDTIASAADNSAR